jgi:RimJ/RimL family protein N-acetyltransferase
MKAIKLVDINGGNALWSATFLYDLLFERDPIANISHREMPTFEQHRDFVESRPYEAWYIVHADDDPIGAIYLTKKDEIGISILKAYQGNGYGKQAIYLLMRMHPVKRFLANIAPGNTRSITMFEKLGFELIQFTFAKDKP